VKGEDRYGWGKISSRPRHVREDHLHYHDADALVANLHESRSTPRPRRVCPLVDAKEKRSCQGGRKRKGAVPTRSSGIWCDRRYARARSEKSELHTVLMASRRLAANKLRAASTRMIAAHAQTIRANVQNGVVLARKTSVG